MWNRCNSSRRLIGIICKWWNHHSFQRRTTQRTPAILMVNCLCWTEEPKSPIRNLTHFLFSLAARNVLQHLKLSSVDVDDFGRDWIRSIERPKFQFIYFVTLFWLKMHTTVANILYYFVEIECMRHAPCRQNSKFDEIRVENYWWKFNWKNCETRKPIKCPIFYWIRFASRFFCFVSLKMVTKWKTFSQRKEKSMWFRMRNVFRFEWQMFRFVSFPMTSTTNEAETQIAREPSEERI